MKFQKYVSKQYKEEPSNNETSPVLEVVFWLVWDFQVELSVHAEDVC